MINEVDICGNRIKFFDIKEVRIVQREYIYRPVYIEERGFLGIKKLNFAKMFPYAAICGEKGEFMTATESAIANPLDLAQSFTKDIAEGTVNVIKKVGEAVGIKSPSNKKYRCVNTAGRVFCTYLEDIPASAVLADGRVVDIYKGSSDYNRLRGTAEPAVLMVSALFISAKDKYLFYGNGIQLDDTDSVYSTISDSLSVYRNSLSSPVRIGSAIQNILGLSSKEVDTTNETLYIESAAESDLCQLFLS